MVIQQGRTLRFLYDGPYEEFKATITKLGMTPLPKYIKRDPGLDSLSKEEKAYFLEKIKNSLTYGQVIILSINYFKKDNISS